MIPGFPRKFSNSKESGKCHTERRLEVDAIEIGLYFPDKLYKDISGEGETDATFSIPVDSFSSSKNELQAWVVEGGDRLIMLDMEGAESVDISFGR